MSERLIERDSRGYVPSPPWFVEEIEGRLFEPEEIICPLADRDQLREIGFVFPEDPDYNPRYQRSKGVEVFEFGEWPMVDLKNPSLMRDSLLFPDVQRMGEWENESGGLISGFSGVGQFGLSRETAIFNLESRGQHSATVGYVSSATCACLARKHPEVFSKATAEYRIFDNHRLHIKHMIRLTALGGVFHDFHPPGGDGMKRATGLDEREMFRLAMEDERKAALFSHLCQEHNLGPPEKVKGWIEAMLERKDVGLIGRLIHGPSKNQADIDFLTYTLTDTVLASLSLVWTFYERATPRLPENNLTPDEFLGQLSLRLSYPENFDPHSRTPFDFEAFNPLRSLRLEDDGGLVFEEPGKLWNLIRLSSVLHQKLYYQPNLIAPQLVLKRELSRNREQYPANREIAQMSVLELRRRLGWLTPVGRLFSPIFNWPESSLNKMGLHVHPWRVLGPMEDEEGVEEYQSYGGIVGIFPINLRLKTRVVDEAGEIMTIREWANRYRDGEGEKLARIEKRYQAPFVILDDTELFSAHLFHHAERKGRDLNSLFGRM